MELPSFGKPRSLVLTRHAMASWAHYRDCRDETARQRLAHQHCLSLPEAAALERLRLNLEAAGPEPDWFNKAANGSVSFRKAIASQLVAGLTVEERAFPDLLRGLRVNMTRKAVVELELRSLLKPQWQARPTPAPTPEPGMSVTGIGKALDRMIEREEREPEPEPPKTEALSPRGFTSGTRARIEAEIARIGLDLHHSVPVSVQREIAKTCGITPSGVSGHLSVIRQSLGIECAERRGGVGTVLQRLDAEIKRREIDLAQQVPNAVQSELAGALKTSVGTVCQYLSVLRNRSGIKFGPGGQPELLRSPAVDPAPAPKEADPMADAPETIAPPAGPEAATAHFDGADGETVQVSTDESEPKAVRECHSLMTVDGKLVTCYRTDEHTGEGHPSQHHRFPLPNGGHALWTNALERQFHGSREAQPQPSAEDERENEHIREMAQAHHAAETSLAEDAQRFQARADETIAALQEDMEKAREDAKAQRKHALTREESLRTELEVSKRALKQFNDERMRYEERIRALLQELTADRTAFREVQATLRAENARLAQQLAASGDGRLRVACRDFLSNLIGETMRPSSGVLTEFALQLLTCLSGGPEVDAPEPAEVE